MKNPNEKKMAQPASPVAMPNIKKRGVKGFYRDVIREMKHVTWPSRQETNRLTGVVITVCLITIAVLLIYSFIFDELISFITQGH